MYTLIINTGEVIRNSDSIIIAPTSDVLNQDYIDYVQWNHLNTIKTSNSPGVEYEFINEEWLLKIDYIKEQKLLEVVNAFNYQFQFGKFTSSLGFDIDNRRYGNKNDKDNIQSLIDLGINTFKDADGNFHTLTAQDLETIKNEMAGDGLKKYQTKWYYENAISTSTDKSFIQGLVITF